tara:strand:+ start:226 stop:990 length:765 start_codon:yes stop_codon:yes gene_type:complete
MILRRLTTALRKQDWVTVVIETLIVVFGVYLGIQLGNWNKANTDKATERQILSQVQADVEAAVALKTDWLASITAHRQKLIEAIDIVQNELETQMLADEACRAMWSSHLLFYPVAPLGSLDELLARGGLHTSRAKAMRPALLTYRDHHEVIQQLNTSLTGLANLGDTYSDAFPRRVISPATRESAVIDPAQTQAARITDSTFQTTCVLDEIRADQTIQNKLLSNLARTDGVLQRVIIELSALEKIEADLHETAP